MSDKKFAEGRVEKSIFACFSSDETVDTGLDTGSPMGDQYRPSSLRLSKNREAFRAAANAEE